MSLIFSLSLIDHDISDCCTNHVVCNFLSEFTQVGRIRINFNWFSIRDHRIINEEFLKMFDMALTSHLCRVKLWIGCRIL